VFWSHKPQIANFRADYAQHADFCDVFSTDTNPLYLLAFLLTANHKEAEECFALTVEEAFKIQSVFKEWTRSWVRRSLIKNAIQIVSPASPRSGQKRDPWSTGHRETQTECAIDTVTKLDPLERFIFVMSVVERHSKWDCALLLGCSMNEVVQVRMKALARLPELVAPFPRNGGLPMRRLGFTA
jgi:DNA-directed RNA polymerase specialized sigma24 family protein